MANEWVAPAVGGGIVAVALDEIFSVGPRVKVAKQQGFNEGWYNRDTQLQPVITAQQNQISNLQNTIASQERALGRAEGVAVSVLVVMQEIINSLGTEKVDKKQLEEMVRKRVIEPVNQLSAQIRETKNNTTYQFR